MSVKNDKRVLAYNRYFKQELEVVGSYKERGQVRYVYRDLIAPFAALLRQRIKDNRQNIVVVTGRTGGGKSTVAIDLARAIEPRWNLAENYIYSLADLRRKLNTPTHSPVSLFDEASVSLNSNNSQTKDSKIMTVIFDTLRSHGQTYILCIPNMKDLNSRVKANHVDYLIMCPNSSPIKGYDPRGIAKIYQHVYRDWGDGYFQLIGTTLFPKLTPQMDKKYQAIKAEHQRILIDQFIAQGEARWRAAPAWSSSARTAPSSSI